MSAVPSFQKGFSIVELLIVIVIIGILASITIVSYNGTQKKAYDTSVQSDLDNIAGFLEAYRTRDDPTNNPNKQFPSTEATLSSLGVRVTKNAYDTSINYNLIYCLNTSGADAYQTYAIVAKSKSGNIFKMTQDGFQSNSLTQSDLTTNLCTTLGMTLVSNGMSGPNTWQSWVGN